MNKREILKLERLIERAEAAYIKQSLSIQAVEKAIKYVGFEKDGGTSNMPDLSIASGGEVILVYENHELYRGDIIELMETKGYIEPSDFLL